MRGLKLLFLGLAMALGMMAQGGTAFNPTKDVKVSLQKGAVVVTVAPTAHLKQSFMEVVLKSKPGTLKVGKMTPPNGKDELGDPIWHGSVRIPLTGEGLSGQVELEVTYQPCTEGEGGVCYAPTTQTLKVKASDIPVEKAETKAAPGAAPVESAPATPEKTQASAEPAAQAAPPKAAPQPQNRSTGLLALLLAAFGAGLLASLTPCVYPMIPITMAIIGAKGGGKARGFVLSLMLVLGMGVTYTALGVVAAATGGTFGAFAQSPGFLIPVSILFAVFATSLFGAFEIQLPMALQAKLQGSGPRQGLGGAFVMGLVLGPLAAPCVGPVVATVLLNIAKQGQIALGALQLFVFSLGMGVLFIIVGTFSAGLPKSGDWLTRLKQGMGLVALGFAVWNIRLVVPEWLNLGLWGLTLLVGAGVFGAFEAAAGLLAQLRKALALLLLLLGLLLGLRGVEKGLDLELLPRGATPTKVEAASGLWIEQDLEKAQAKAKAEGKLVLVDTYAEWCAQCKELDEKTWPDAAIQAWIRKHAIAVRIDTYKVRPDLGKRLEVQNYPTIILLDAQGKEQRRTYGFLKPATMLAWLEGK